MKLIEINAKNFEAEAARIVATSSLFDKAIEERTRSIIDDVARKGDRALIDLTRKFDGADLDVGSLRVGAGELASASRAVGKELKSALKFSAKNVADFARKSMRKAWSGRNAQGAKVGEKFDAFSRVGIYIPGGTAPLISTAVMTITLAKAAGCRDIVVCTPCGKDGGINPNLLHAAKIAGATEIYRVGGAQAIAALALGTDTIASVQKIFGPGNAYVVTAKRLLVGHVAIDLLPGPSELVIVADETADPRFATSDILAQAEHGSGHERVYLISTSKRLVRSIQAEVTRQLPTLARREFIQRSLDQGSALVHIRTLEQAIELTNRIAPEHCELMVTDARVVSKRILTSGAIFLGNESPTALGDYVAGPSHVLPTGGAGRSFAGLTVDQFQRRTSIVEYDRRSLEKSVTAVETLAGLEGLDAHARSVSIRAE